MAAGRIKNGFEFEIDDECLDDMEVLEEVAGIEKGEVWRVGTVLEKILGREKKKELYESLRNDKGRIPIESVSEAFEEIIKSINQGKN